MNNQQRHTTQPTATATASQRSTGSLISQLLHRFATTADNRADILHEINNITLPSPAVPGKTYDRSPVAGPHACRTSNGLSPITEMVISIQPSQGVDMRLNTKPIASSDTHSLTNFLRGLAFLFALLVLMAPTGYADTHTSDVWPYVA
ncbi:MAG: hypothetical protein WBQ23_03075 [Bacteroidota bacterium]